MKAIKQKAIIPLTIAALALIHLCPAYASSPDFVFIERVEKGRYTSPVGNTTVALDKILKEFYKTHSDDYDFIILVPAMPGFIYDRYNTEVVENEATGLNKAKLPFRNLLLDYSKKLKGIALVGLGTSYYNFKKELERTHADADRVAFEVYKKSDLSTFLSAIAQYWGIYLYEVTGKYTGPWYSNALDLFSGNENYLDPLAMTHWIVKNNKETCVDQLDTQVEYKFSNLTMYLMGFMPPEEVGPIYIHEFQQQPNDKLFNLWGPHCYAKDKYKRPIFKSTKTLTINQIIAANGKRKPSFEKSQKDFHIIFVIMTEPGQKIAPEFLKFVKACKDALPEAWHKATSGRSKLYY